VWAAEWGMRPRYHVAPARNWMNDPNGPICHEGVWHLFYQQCPAGKEWSFGIEWGHVLSDDMVTWRRAPQAIVPTPGHYDAAGCFSGCVTVDGDGSPVMLYTGVRMRDKMWPREGHGPEELPPEGRDLKLEFIESQLAAVADPGDPELKTWRKCERPVIELPPRNDLEGFRDPFIFQRGGNGKEWIMLVGSGVRGQGGAVLVYRSYDLTNGWTYDGFLCEGCPGNMWECPLLVPLNALPMRRPNAHSALLRKNHSVETHLCSLADGHDKGWTPGPGMKRTSSTLSMDTCLQKHLLCISPDAPNNPVLCWLGTYADGRFDIEEASGPFLLDLGDVVYAPNVTRDAQGRWVLWGWLQEKDPPTYLDHAGCLSVPRVLYIQGDHLVQEPAAELAALRRECLWHEIDFAIHHEATSLSAVTGPSLYIEISILREMSKAVGIVIPSWRANGVGTAVIMYDWKRSQLKVVTHTIAFDPNHPFAPGCRETGGSIRRAPGAMLELRIFLDASCLEIFTGDGQVLSTRVYRGPAGAADADPGIDLVSLGGHARVARVAAYQMSTIWEAECARRQVEVAQIEKMIPNPMGAVGVPEVAKPRGGETGFGGECGVLDKVVEEEYEERQVEMGASFLLDGGWGWKVPTLTDVSRTLQRLLWGASVG